MKSMLIGVMLFIVSLPIFANVRDANKIEEKFIKSAVYEGLKDPDSANFKNIKIDKDGFFCGDVNSKNSFGGYTGFYKFIGMYFDIGDGDPSATIMSLDNTDEDAALYMCTDKNII